MLAVHTCVPRIRRPSGTTVSPIPQAYTARRHDDALRAYLGSRRLFFGDVAFGRRGDLGEVRDDLLRVLRLTGSGLAAVKTKRNFTVISN